jgi:hypothetical protein
MLKEGDSGNEKQRKMKRRDTNEKLGMCGRMNKYEGKEEANCWMILNKCRKSSISTIGTNVTNRTLITMDKS